MHKAVNMMRRGEYEVDSDAVLTVVAATKQSANDCEFVVLARRQCVPVVSADERWLQTVPDATISIIHFSES